MNINSVESATLAAIGYEDAHKVLQLEFRNGAVYRYAGVPGGVHEALLGAASKGRYFNEAIRGQYTHWRIGNAEGERRGQS